jgi:hypothetical protein
MSQPQPEDPLTAKKHEKVIYISNLSEDVWPFIQAISSDQERVHEIEENANLADRELFAASDESDLVFITPKPFQPEFLEYYRELMGLRKLQVLSPKEHTGLTSEDIINDTELFETLVQMADGVKKLTLISYSTSFQFLNLVKKLRDRGISVYTPEAPDEEDAWTVNFYGSKSGIRQLGQQSVAEEPDFMMAEGLICVSIIDAARIAANKYLKEDGVVIKTNKGHSGAGVLIFREGELPTEYHACEAAILKILQKDEYWDRFPIVIESLINVNMAVGGGFPNVEFKVRKSGEVELLYFCGLRVDKEGVFHGVEIHESVLSDRVEARVTDMGFYVGEEYARDGYRGYYDVDLVAAKNGEIYVSESNTRRTGGTHAYKTALKLIGKDFMSDAYTLSDNNYALPGGIRPKFTDVLSKLSPILFNKKTKEGVVIASANLLQQGSLAYTIFGHNKKRSLEIEDQMFELLRELA